MMFVQKVSHRECLGGIPHQCYVMMLPLPLLFFLAFPFDIQSPFKVASGAKDSADLAKNLGDFGSLSFEALVALTRGLDVAINLVLSDY